MVDKWVGKYAVVTGSSAGIGSEIFKDFARNGINVIGLARRKERVDEIIKELGETKGKAIAYQCDVSDPTSVTETFKWVQENFGYASILVNNAGIGRNVNFFDDDEEAFRKMNEVIDTNVRGLMQCTREAYRLMKKADDYGLIININSVCGHYVPFLGINLNIYPASKFAVTALSESIRQELIAVDNKKVRVTNLSPGGVSTEIGIASGYYSTPPEESPTGSILKSEQVSHSVMFLLSTDYNVNITELTIRPVGEKG